MVRPAGRTYLEVEVLYMVESKTVTTGSECDF